MSPFEQRQFSSSQVRKAGELLRRAGESVSAEQLAEAEGVLDNFRALHAVPLNTFQATLRARLRRLGIKDYIVAQRIKRKPTILDKLRHRENDMMLDRMDDIGGIRAIVPNMADLRALADTYLAAGNRHKLKHKITKPRDYITQPKASGYRGIHIAFRYHDGQRGRKDYEGLRIEMQLRTKLQHIWATAVETFEAFMGEKFKSSQGSHEWLDFFALASSAFACVEKQPLVPCHQGLSPEEISARLRKMIKELRVMEKMRGFTLAEKMLSSVKKGDKHALLVFDAKEKTASIRGYEESQYESAYANYLREERRSAGDDMRLVVLIRMASIEKFKKAYPNYCADLEDFKRWLEKVSA